MSGDRASKETKIIILLIILSLVVWGAVYGLNKNKNEKAASAEEHLELIRSTGIPDEILYEDAGSVTTLVREGTNWKCVEGDFYINTTITTYLFSVVKHFDPMKDCEIGDNDLAGTGLRPPERKVRFIYPNGDIRTFMIGKYNPIVGLYYFTMEGDDRFYMIPPEEAVFFLVRQEHMKAS